MGHWVQVTRTIDDVARELQEERRTRCGLLQMRDDGQRKALLAASRGRLDRLLDEWGRMMGM
jgi:uncharacterized protein YjiS (DUF1127 family)